MSGESRPSSRTYDAIVVGGGHNGLVAAAYLARGGLRTLVLERREILGGAAVTEEFHPGFRVDTGAHCVGALNPAVSSDLGLARHGLEIVRPDPTLFAPQPDGRGLFLWRDLERSAESIGGFSPADARRWPDFVDGMGRAAAALATIHAKTPPAVPGNDAGDLWELIRLGGALRRHGRRELLELARLLPMSVAELLDDWFESDTLKGVLAAGGISGIFQGPMASGTTYVLLHGLAGGGGPMRPTRWVMGGIGRLADALAEAARGYGAELRTGAPVDRILVEDGRAIGVVLGGGEEIRARLVASSADPGTTFLGLLDPLELDPDFVRKVRNIKYRGACAKVHLALGELPEFRVAPSEEGRLRGAISISPSVEYLERAYDDAKYGRCSTEPYLEAFIPTLWDPSLAPAGTHVMSILVQYAPYRLGDGGWSDARREGLGDVVVDTLGRYAPNLEAAVLGRQVLSPADLEARFGLTEGNPHQGELTLDQLLFMRPVPGWARYRTPIRSLYLCGAGAHPGGGLTGTPGHNAAREILKDMKAAS